MGTFVGYGQWGVVCFAFDGKICLGVIVNVLVKTAKGKRTISILTKIVKGERRDK